jgi:hypothetical protein
LIALIPGRDQDAHPHQEGYADYGRDGELEIGIVPVAACIESRHREKGWEDESIQEAWMVLQGACEQSKLVFDPLQNNNTPATTPMERMAAIMIPMQPKRQPTRVVSPSCFENMGLLRCEYMP